MLLAGCKKGMEERESSNLQHRGDTVIVANRTLNEKLKVQETQVMPYSKEVVTAGTVQAIPTQFAYVAPPFSGRVMKSCVRLGQQVTEGTPLFEISSPTSPQHKKISSRHASPANWHRKTIGAKRT